MVGDIEATIQEVTRRVLEEPGLDASLLHGRAEALHRLGEIFSVRYAPYSEAAGVAFPLTH